MKNTLFLMLIVCIVIGTVLVLLPNQPKTSKHTVVAEKISAAPKKAGNTDTGSILNANKPAPEFTGITMWFNLPDGKNSLKLTELRGKVVLVDFWTNQCINCIHTLPYITKWYSTYKDQGLVVIGVHTPELAYEYSAAGVKDAMKQYNITYPVAQDNDYMTWRAYDNQYWPSIYLIDKQGLIRRTHFGEEEYTETETAIKTLLSEANK